MTKTLTGDYIFDNGYGASVIAGGYGGDRGLLELAVTDDKGRILYDTPITSYVLGWLTEDEVVQKLAEIEALPKREAA